MPVVCVSRASLVGTLKVNFADQGAGTTTITSATGGSFTSSKSGTGSVTFPGIAPDTYTLTSTRSGSVNNVQTATVPSSSTKEVTVSFQANPVSVINVDFSAVNNGTAGRVDFTAYANSNMGAITFYAWNFGDGNTATGATPANIYASAGSYTVTLTAQDATGNSNFIQKVVAPAFAVTPPDPQPTEFTADFTIGAKTITVNSSTNKTVENYTFTAAQGNSDGKISSYVWAFQSGTPASAQGNTSASTYATNGTYNVTLTVTHIDGRTKSVTKTVTVTGAGVDQTTQPQRTPVTLGARQVFWQRGGLNGDNEPYPVINAPAEADNTRVGIVLSNGNRYAQTVSIAVPAGSIPASGSSVKFYGTFTGGAGSTAWVGPNPQTPEFATYVSTDSEITNVVRTYQTIYVGRFGNSDLSTESFDLSAYTL